MVEVTTPLTIEQKAREIAAKANSIWADACAGPGADTIAARLGITEGLEMAARVAEKIEDHTGEEIAAAIRALIEEQKV